MSTKNTPSSEVLAGGWWESVNTGLAAALGHWERVETVKGIKSASGQDQQQAMYRPELQNGAAIQVDKVNALTAKEDGITINKPVLYASLGLLGLAFVMRLNGYK